jgi:hypothetical protein
VAVPLAAAVAWGIVVFAGRGDNTGELTWEFWLILGLVLAVASGLCLIGGVGLRRAARAATRDEPRRDLSARGRS